MAHSSRPLVETLETRRLMAVSPLPDLTIAFGALPTIPSAVKTKLVVNVSNVGNGVAKGRIVIHLTGDGTTLTDQSVSLQLKPKTHKAITLHFVLPDSRNASLGQVYQGQTGVPVDLAVTVDSTNKISEQDETNNTATADQVPVESVAYRNYLRQIQGSFQGGGGWWWF